jgi:hypothetical protein
LPEPASATFCQIALRTGQIYPEKRESESTPTRKAFNVAQDTGQLDIRTFSSEADSYAPTDVEAGMLTVWMFVKTGDGITFARPGRTYTATGSAGAWPQNSTFGAAGKFWNFDFWIYWS